MDSLICQAHYNHALTTVLTQLIVGDSGARTKENTLDGDFSHVKTSNLYQVKVPEQFSGKKYSKLFDYLTTRRYMIPLGLYRQETVNFSSFRDDKDTSKRDSLGVNRG